MKITRRPDLTLIRLARNAWLYVTSHSIVVRFCSFRYQWVRAERRGFLMRARSDK